MGCVPTNQLYVVDMEVGWKGWYGGWWLAVGASLSDIYLRSSVAIRPYPSLPHRPWTRGRMATSPGRITISSQVG